MRNKIFKKTFKINAVMLTNNYFPESDLPVTTTH